MAAWSEELAGVAQPTTLVRLRQRSPARAAGSEARYVAEPVVPPLCFGDDPGLLQTEDDLAVEQCIAQADVEALEIAVLPGIARRDIGRLRTDRGDPVLHGLGN